jgi:predicted nucleic acid-binding protein
MALMNREDRHYQRCRAVFTTDIGPYYFPVSVVAEITWMLETRLPPNIEDDFLEDLKERVFTLDWLDRDLIRIHDLVRRYRDLPLGFADAAVIACAERHGGRVLTTDRRHFPVVARGERTITTLPL